MVQSGIQRAFGPSLRRVLGLALGSRLKAFLVGAGVTAVLQSSTATGLLVASFAAGGLVALVPALAVMLGANVGTTLIVQVLSFDIGRITPLLVLFGVVMFRRGAESRTRDLGRVAIGLALMLMALSQLPQVIRIRHRDRSDHRPAGRSGLYLGGSFQRRGRAAGDVVRRQGRRPVHRRHGIGANLGSALNPVLDGLRSGDAAGRRRPR